MLGKYDQWYAHKQRMLSGHWREHIAANIGNVLMAVQCKKYIYTYTYIYVYIYIHLYIYVCILKAIFRLEEPSLLHIECASISC